MTREIFKRKTGTGPSTSDNYVAEALSIETIFRQIQSDETIPLSYRHHFLQFSQTERIAKGTEILKYIIKNLNTGSIFTIHYFNTYFLLSSHCFCFSFCFTAILLILNTREASFGKNGDKHAHGCRKLQPKHGQTCTVMIKTSCHHQIPGILQDNCAKNVYR